MQLDKWVFLALVPLSEPPSLNPQNGGPNKAASLSREHQNRGTQGAPKQEAIPSPHPLPGPCTLGSRLQEALCFSHRPCLAALPSQGNLIVFPRLRSISPRRRQNEALKGPAAHPWPAGRGSPIVRPGPSSMLWKDRLPASAQPMVTPTPRGCVVHNQPDLSELPPP